MEQATPRVMRYPPRDRELKKSTAPWAEGFVMKRSVRIAIQVDVAKCLRALAFILWVIM